MSEINWVRIRTESDAEVSVSALYAEAIGAEVLEAPATNSRGLPLAASRKDGRPMKPRTTVSTEAAKKATTSTPGGVAAKQPEEATE